MVIYSGFSHEKWWFSIAMLNYQRVTTFENKPENKGGRWWWFDLAVAAISKLEPKSTTSSRMGWSLFRALQYIDHWKSRKFRVKKGFSKSCSLLLYCFLRLWWGFYYVSMRFQCGVQSCFHEVSSGFNVVSMWFPLGFHGVSMWFPSSSHGKSLSHHQVVLRSVESTSEMSTEAGASGPDGTHPIYGHHFGECLVVFHDLIWEKKKKKHHYHFFR